MNQDSNPSRSRKHSSSRSPSRTRRGDAAGASSSSSPIMNDFPSLKEDGTGNEYDKYELNDSRNRHWTSSNNRNSIYLLPGDEEQEDRDRDQQYISPSAYGKPFPRNNTQDQSSSLLPPNTSRSGGRRRNDSYSSIGSSVAPAGLHARGNNNDSRSRSPRKFIDPSQSSIGASAAGGGLENWLRSQGASPTADHNQSSAAPSGRIRRLGGNGGGSDAGSAISGWSQGGLSGSGRRKDRDRERRQASGDKLNSSSSRRPLPTFEEPDDSLESIQQWRETSAVVAPNDGEEMTAGGGLTTSKSKSESLSSSRKDRDREMSSKTILNGSTSNSTSTPLIITPGSRRTGPPSSKGGGRSSSRISTSNLPPPPPLPLLHSSDTNNHGSSHSGLNSTPLRRAVRWLAKLDGKDSSKITTTSILLTCIFVKWCVGLSGWSGRGSPPMFGDFEAQRHWMEITLNLPIKQWYFYDLQYWGLDYPPLTAWVSLLCGKAGVSLFGLNSSFALDSSRGSENPQLSVFMRSSVLFFDLLIYIPAILFFLSRKLDGRGRRTKAIALATVLLQPSTILIDNGHFQYNSFMLGLSALAFGYLNTSLPNPDLHLQVTQTGSQSPPLSSLKDETTDRKELSKEEKERKLRFETVTNLSRGVSYEYVLAAIAFTYSLGFKQMALFFAPAIFAIMLGRCYGLAMTGAERGLALFSGLGLSVIISFMIMLWPWLGSISSLGQILHRIFPIARGIFEDKVSNFWCFISVLPLPPQYKLKNVLNSSSLARLSLITTLIFILPPCVHLFRSAKQTVQVEMNLADDFKTRNEAYNNRMLKSGSSTSLRKDKRPGSPNTVRSGREIGTFRNQLEENQNQESRALSVSGRSIQGGGVAVERRRTRAPSAAASEAGSELTALLSVTRGDTSLPNSSSLRFDLADQSSKSRDRYLHNSSSSSGPQRAIASSTPSPSALLLPYGLLSTSLTFFLFGFQTHEKSILIPLLPLTLLMGAKGDDWGGGANEVDWEWAVLGNNVAVFSMWPLLQRDGLGFQYLVLVFFWNWIIGHRPFSELREARKNFVAWIGALIHLAILSLHLLEMLLPILSPSINSRVISRFPDLFPVLNVLLTTPCLILIWLWSLKRQLEVGFSAGLGGIGLWILGGRKSIVAKKGNDLTDKRREKENSREKEKAEEKNV